MATIYLDVPFSQPVPHFRTDWSVHPIDLVLRLDAQGVSKSAMPTMRDAGDLELLGVTLPACECVCVTLFQHMISFVILTL